MKVSSSVKEGFKPIILEIVRKKQGLCMLFSTTYLIRIYLTLQYNIVLQIVLERNTTPQVKMI